LREWHGARVVDEDGRDLGNVIDLRCADAPSRRHARDTMRVESLVFGSNGWLERIGLRDHAAYVAQCKDVLRYERGTFVVRRARYRLAR